MSDQPYPVDWGCDGTGYESITSNVHWATGYVSPAPGGSKVETTNIRDWDSAREDYHIYLTGMDFQGQMIAPREQIRKVRFGRALRSLGHVLHLIQDMAVPSHVRSDFKAHLDWKGIPFPNIHDFDPREWGKQFFYERFEDFVKTNGGVVSGGSGGNLEEKTITNFWDTNNYTGSNPDISLESGRIGLAEYTNINFVSMNTIFAEEFLTDGDPSNDVYHHPYPRKSSTNVQQYLDGVLHPEEVLGEDNVPDTSFYIAKTGDGEQINHFLKPSYLSPYVRDLFEAGPEIFVRTLLLDDKCLEDYASKLLPKAVGYSAALLEYFFRGRIEVRAAAVARDNGGNIAGVNLQVKNTTKIADQPEAMEQGTLSLAYKYLPQGATDHSYGFVENIHTISDANNPINADYVPLAVTLPDAIPPKARDIAFTLVYRGKLGNEDGAVVARVLPLTSKIAYSGQPGCSTNPSFVFTIPPDGTEDANTQITDASDGYAWRAWPSWSADGKLLAFNGITSDNRYEIVVVDLSSDQAYPNNIKRIMRDPQCHYISPSLSPDGTKIVAQRLKMQHPPDQSDLYDAIVVFDVNTGDWSFPGGIDFWRDKPIPEQPRWSPRGDRIVFQHLDAFQDPYAIFNIWSMDPEGSELTRLTDELYDSRWPAWSQDGSKVAFASKRDGGYHYGLWIMNATGEDKVKLVDWDIDFVSFSFSPDGEKIVFQVVGGRIYTMNLDGTDLRELQTIGCSGTPGWSPLIFDLPNAP